MTSTIEFGALSFTKDSATTVLEKIKRHVEGGTAGVLSVITPNIFHLNLATKDPSLATDFNGADVRVPDGWPIAAALRAFYGYKGGRIAGSDLSLDVLSLAEERSYSVGLVGGSDQVLESAYANLGRRYPRLKLVDMGANPVLPNYPTRESKTLLLEAINDTPVDILLLCLGAPKSETHLEACREDIEARVVLCVGATVDFLGGSVKRAPSWMQLTGFEWLFRLVQEPSRLWRRYLTSGSTFALIFLRETFNVLMHPSDGSERKKKR